MKSASVLSLFASFGLIVIAVACTKTVTKVVPVGIADAGTVKDASVTTKPSGDDDDTKGDDDDTKGDDDDDDTTSSSSSSSSSGTAVPKVADCKKKTNQQDCGSCCGEISPDGFKKYSSELQKCVCSADVCLDACKSTLCAAQPKNPNPACNECFSGAQETCAEPVITACTADAKCKVFNDCVNTAECATKPNP